VVLMTITNVSPGFTGVGISLNSAGVPNARAGGTRR
jgi:hypothetical protein